MQTTSRLELANQIAAHFNKFGSIPQDGFRPDYSAKVWVKGDVVRIYVRNGSKDCGSLTIEADGSIGDKYAKLGGFGYHLLEAAKGLTA